MSLRHESSPPCPPSDSKPTVKSNTFRFKSKHSRSPSPTHSRKHHRHHHRRHRHRPRSRSRSPPVDRETAFRESLFDALADDEGAAFWEGVYGQPIHTYSPYKISEKTPSTENPDEEPTLERMTDEEYAKYVRAKMWEKSYGYIAEEKAKREAERERRRKREREEGRRGQGPGGTEERRDRGAGRPRQGGTEERREREVWESQFDEVLGRREEERASKMWKSVWESYVRGWEELRRRVEEKASVPGPADVGETTASKGKIKPWKASMLVWPTKSGKLHDVDAEAVEDFLRNAPQPEEEGRNVDLLAVLKMERVRWHPDKVQQRYGSLGIDDATQKGVTTVFQIIDRMWGDMKGKAG